MAEYKLKNPKTIENGVVNTYKAVENAVVGTYKKIESGVVGAYKKVENKFVETFLDEVSDDEGAPAATRKE